MKENRIKVIAKQNAKNTKYYQNMQYEINPSQQS